MSFELFALLIIIAADLATIGVNRKGPNMMAAITLSVLSFVAGGLFGATAHLPIGIAFMLVAAFGTIASLAHAYCAGLRFGRTTSTPKL